MLHAKVLGGFSLSAADGKTVDLSSKKARALFLYLAMRPDQRVSRDRLALLLWDAVSDAQARTNLRQALAAIRRALPDSDIGVLAAERDTVALVRHGIETDVETFRQLSKSKKPEDLESAAALYDGAFADGLNTGSQEFDDWVTAERFSLREQHVSNQLALLHHFQAKGSSNKSISVAAQVLIDDPMREEAHRALMYAYAQSGRKGAAIKRYRACQEVLREELGTAPSQETQDLFQRIMSDELERGVGAVAPGEASEVATPETAGIADTVASPEKIEPPEASIAVLPFVNMSSDPEQEYFSDGIAEELLNLLAKIRDLHVAARTSSFQFKGQSAAASEIGRQLNVRHVLEGSVRKSSNRVRITAQLIDAETGFHKWSQSFDRELNDIFEVQDEISASISEALKVHILGGEDAVKTHRTTNMAAYEEYLRGHQLLVRRGSENLKQAQSLFEDALALDPDYFPALLGMADSHFLLSDDPKCHGDVPVAVACRRALPFLERAKRIDPASADLAVIQSVYHMLKGELETAEQFAKEAIAASPSHARAYNQLAVIYATRGSPQDPIVDVFKRALVLDPLSVPTLMNLALSACLRLNEERVLFYSERVREIAPEGGRSEFPRGVYCWHSGQFAEGLRWFLRAFESDSGGRNRANLLEGFVLLGEGSKVDRLIHDVAFNAYLDMGDYASARAAMSDAGLAVDDVRSLAQAHALAQIAAAEGDDERVVQLLSPFDGPCGPNGSEMYGWPGALLAPQTLASGLRRLEREDEAQEVVRKIGDSFEGFLADPGGIPNFTWRAGAFVALMRGDADAALERLQRQLDQTFYRLLDLHSVPTFRELRGNVKFEELVSNVAKMLENEQELATKSNLIPYAGQLD